MKDVSKRMARGAAWMVLLKLSERGIGLVSTLVLARLLIPADFGLVAIGTSIYAALETMSTFSFDLALIQNQRAERRHYDTAWTFTVLFGVANATLLAVLAKPAATFFSDPRLEGVMYLLGVGALIDGFSNIGVVAFQKDLELQKEFRFGIAKKLIAFFVTMAIAYLTRSYWALVAGIVVGRAAGMALSYWMQPYRPRFSLAAARDLFHFSKWLLCNNILIFINNRGMDFVVGKISGAQALGLYSVALELSNLPTTELVWPIQRAVFPGYSKIAGDAPALRDMFLQVISLIAILTIPIGIGIGLLADPVVRVLLGEKWLATVPLIQLLAVFGVVRTLHGPPGSIYLALGKPYVISYLHLLFIAIAVPMLFWLMSAHGVIGAAWAVVIAISVSMPANYLLVMRALDLRAGTLVDALWRPIVAAAIMVLVGIWLDALWTVQPGLLPSFLRLLGLGSVAAVVYVSVVALLWSLARRPSGAEQKLVALWRARFPGVAD